MAPQNKAFCLPSMFISLSLQASLRTGENELLVEQLLFMELAFESFLETSSFLTTLSVSLPQPRFHSD